MAEHKGATDSVHKVTLPSAIQRAAWGAASAGPGESVPAEVVTLFVADGSEVDFEFRTRGGKSVGKAKGAVSISRSVIAFKIPDGTEEDLYFEAQLGKHGLKGRSELLRIGPPRPVSNARWDRKEARRGDVVKLQADTKGIPDGMEARITIYEHDADGAHDPVTEIRTTVEKSKIETEWAYDYYDDTDEIPTKEEAEKGYKNPEFFFRACVGGCCADSGLLLFKDWIELHLKDASGAPIPNADYVIHLPDGSEKRGKLDASGSARVADIPPGPVHVEYPGLKERR